MFSTMMDTFFLSPYRQLVKSGVLTVRDAGSWWFSIPNSGKFTKYLIQGECFGGGNVTQRDDELRTSKTLCTEYRILCVFPPGRKAVLGMVKKAKYSEVLQAELQERRTTSHVKFHMKYHIHDIVGAELVER